MLNPIAMEESGLCRFGKLEFTLVLLVGGSGGGGFGFGQPEGRVFTIALGGGGI